MSNVNNTKKAVIAGIAVLTVLALDPILNSQKASALDDCGVGYYLGLFDSYLNYVFSDGHLNPTAPGGGIDPFGPSDGHLNPGDPYDGHLNDDFP